MAFSALSFRFAVRADVHAIVALVESAYRGDSSRVGWTTEADLLDGQRTDAQEVRDLIESERTRVLLCAREGELIASVALTKVDSAVAYLGMFAVRPTQQGGGVGRAVLAEAERVAREELAARRLRMTVIGQRTELIAWYERRGFVRTGQRESFPYGDPRFGLPRRDDLYFEVLEKPLL